MTVTVVVGNPKPASRTRDAAELLAKALTGSAPDQVVELSDLGPGLLTWGADTAVDAALEQVRSSAVAVFACPTYKGTYTGLLKLFLDRIPGGDGLAGVVGVPLMLGAAADHALAPDLTLRPVLSTLGATCALPGLYLIDSTYTSDGALDGYAEHWSPVVRALAPAG